MFCADLLRWFAHGAQLIRQWVCPEISQQHRAQKQGEGAVAGAPGRLHLGDADGFHVELQDHDGENDHPKREDEGGPGVNFALWKKKYVETLNGNSQEQRNDHKHHLRGNKMYSTLFKMLHKADLHGNEQSRSKNK